MSVVSVTNMRYASYGRNFQNIATTTNRPWLITYEKTLSHCGTDIWKLWLFCFFFQHLIFLLTVRILLHSPDFGRSKHGQKCPLANFCQKGIWSRLGSHHLTFYYPSQYFFSFPSNGPKSKKLPFLTDFLVRLQKKVSGSCTFWCHNLPHS